MEKELYQSIAKEVRTVLQTTATTDPRKYPLIKNPTTLKGGCQNAAVMVRERLRQRGQEPQLLRLYYGFGGKPWDQGTHIVAYTGGLIIDPTITQFFPETRDFVFSEDAYPLPVGKREDVSNSKFFR